MRIILDIVEGLIDRWGCVVIEPAPPVQGQQYKAPKVTVPCFVYRVPADPNQATFRATVGSIPQSAAPVSPPGVATATKTVDAKPDLRLHEDSPEKSESETEPQKASKPGEAVPSDEEKGGDAEPDGKKKK